MKEYKLPSDYKRLVKSINNFKFQEFGTYLMPGQRAFLKGVLLSRVVFEKPVYLSSNSKIQGLKINAIIYDEAKDSIHSKPKTRRKKHRAK